MGNWRNIVQRDRHGGGTNEQEKGHMISSTYLKYNLMARYSTSPAEHGKPNLAASMQRVMSSAEWSVTGHFSALMHTRTRQDTEKTPKQLA